MNERGEDSRFKSFKKITKGGLETFEPFKLHLRSYTSFDRLKTKCQIKNIGTFTFKLI